MVEAVGDGVTDVAPGDFVILNWRAVCGECRACRRGRPWYCFATHNAQQKMTLSRRHRAVPRAGHRRVRREDAGRGRPVHQGRPGRPARGGRPARLRRDGRPRRGDQHRRCRPAATRSPSSAAAGSATRRSLGARLAGARTIIARRRRRPQAGVGQAVRRHPRDQLPGDRPGRGDPGADRRERRRRGDRGGRPPGDLPAGVLRPRPGRDRGAGRRAHPGHAAGAAAARLLRPRRRAQVVLVRRLPARAATSPCSSTCTCRAGCRWTSSCRRPSRSTQVEAAFAKMQRG